MLVREVNSIIGPISSPKLCFGKIPIGKWCKLGSYKTFVYNVAKLYRKTMWEPFCIQPVKI